MSVMKRTLMMMMIMFSIKRLELQSQDVPVARRLAQTPSDTNLPQCGELAWFTTLGRVSFGILLTRFSLGESRNSQTSSADVHSKTSSSNVSGVPPHQSVEGVNSLQRVSGHALDF